MKVRGRAHSPVVVDSRPMPYHKSVYPGEIPYENGNTRHPQCYQVHSSRPMPDLRPSFSTSSFKAEAIATRASRVTDDSSGYKDIAFLRRMTAWSSCAGAKVPTICRLCLSTILLSACWSSLRYCSTRLRIRAVTGFPKTILIRGLCQNRGTNLGASRGSGIRMSKPGRCFQI